jgi:type I site-specific restriction endonuclease
MVLKDFWEGVPDQAEMSAVDLVLYYSEEGERRGRKLQEVLNNDYLLFVGGKAVGVLEAKPTGSNLSGVAEQATKYLFSIPPNLICAQMPLPFAYESTGAETFSGTFCPRWSPKPVRHLELTKDIRI